MINRREMLLASVAAPIVGLAASKPVIANVLPKVEYDWYTHNEIASIYNQVVTYNKKYNSKRAMNRIVKDPILWHDGKFIGIYEAFYLNCMNISNWMNRRTFDTDSQHWIVTSPKISESKIFPKYILDDQTPVEVAPGVWKSRTMNCKWQIYVDDKFPDHHVLLGRGFRKVVGQKPTGKMLKYEFTTPQEPKFFEYPEMRKYWKIPTIDHYATIRIVL